MARQFIDTSNQYLQAGSTLSLSVPYSIAVLFKPLSFPGGGRRPIFCIQEDEIQRYHQLAVKSTGALIFEHENGAGYSAPTTSATMSAGNWYWCCGSANSLTSRTVWLDGTSETSAGGSVTTPNWNVLRLGRFSITASVHLYVHGVIQCFAIWSTSMTTAEADRIGAKRIHPVLAKPFNLIDYWDFTRSLVGIKGNVFTATNGPTIVANSGKLIQIPSSYRSIETLTSQQLAVILSLGLTGNISNSSFKGGFPSSSLSAESSIIQTSSKVTLASLGLDLSSALEQTVIRDIFSSYTSGLTSNLFQTSFRGLSSEYTSGLTNNLFQTSFKAIPSSFILGLVGDSQEDVFSPVQSASVLNGRAGLQEIVSNSIDRSLTLGNQASLQEVITKVIEGLSTLSGTSAIQNLGAIDLGAALSLDGLTDLIKSISVDFDSTSNLNTNSGIDETTQVDFSPALLLSGDLSVSQDTFKGVFDTLILDTAISNSQIASIVFGVVLALNTLNTFADVFNVAQANFGSSLSLDNKISILNSGFKNTLASLTLNARNTIDQTLANILETTLGLGTTSSIAQTSLIDLGAEYISRINSGVSESTQTIFSPDLFLDIDNSLDNITNGSVFFTDILLDALTDTSQIGQTTIFTDNFLTLSVNTQIGNRTWVNSMNIMTPTERLILLLD